MRRSSSFWTMTVVLALPMSIAFCIPDVHFVDDDTDASDAKRDANDAGTSNTCPVAQPPGADSCCDKIACYGSNCSSKCSDCKDTCGGYDKCCVRGNSVKCKAAGEPCQ